MPVSLRYRSAPRYPTLGDALYDEVAPARFPRHALCFRNQRWAERVGLGALDDAEWEACFARFEPLPDNLTAPLALRYHGHQFDVYNPQLGDGRGFLYAQLLDDAGRLLDLGTKGSGPTPWSRGGDGRLTLKGGVREVLATEMLEALGVPTSKSLSLFETGEALMRSDEPSPTRSSVLVRLSHSHVRFGTFQRLAYGKEVGALDRLLSYSIRHYYPDVGEGPQREERFLARVARASAVLCAAFMVAGFVHGVLNSDNMNITGEAFDYGPYRFLPRYQSDFVAAYFDQQGLYAFGQQPRAFLRNLVRLGNALRPLSPDLALAAALADFETILAEKVVQGTLARMGLVSDGDADSALVAAVYTFLEESDIGFDRFFFDVRGGLERKGRTRAGDTKNFYSGPAWESLWALLDLYQPVRAGSAAREYFAGPAPCSLLIDEIETIWSAIDHGDDWSPFTLKVREIRAMGAALADGS